MVRTGDTTRPNSGRFILIATLAAAAYVAGWYCLAEPYRYFPTDDRMFLEEGRRDALEARLPVFVVAIEAARRVARALSLAAPNELLILALLCQAATLISGMWIVWQLSQRVAWSVVASVAYAVAPWPATYYFFASYASLAGALFVTSAALLVAAYLSKDDGGSNSRARTRRSASTLSGRECPGREAKYIVAAGATAAALVLSSSSGLVGVVALSIIAVCLFTTSAPRGCRSVSVFLGTISGIILLGNPGTLLAQLHHFEQNLLGRHYAEAVARFGDMPKPPTLLLGSVLGTYSPLLLVATAAAVALLIVVLRRRDVDAQRARAVVGLFAGVVSWEALVDLLLGAKPARTFFPAFPLLLFAVVSAPALRGALPSTHLRRLLATATITLLGASMVLDLNHTAELLRVRRDTVNVLAGLREYPLYVHATEVDEEVLQTFLQGSATPVASLAVLLDEMAAQHVHRLDWGSSSKWLGLEIAAWEESPDGTVFASTPGNSMREGRGLVLSRTSWSAYTLTTRIENVGDGGIVTNWYGPGDFTLLVVRPSGVYWHRMNGGVLSAAFGHHRFDREASQVELTVHFAQGVTQVLKSGTMIAEVTGVAEPGRVGLYDYQSPGEKQRFRLIAMKGTGASGQGVAVLGPTGAGSGMSILRHCILPDQVDEARTAPSGVEVLKLPYFAYFPPFLLEEEVCQTLYFSGRVPHYAAEGLQVEVWRWNQPPLTHWHERP